LKNSDDLLARGEGWIIVEKEGPKEKKGKQWSPGLKKKECEQLFGGYQKKKKKKGRSNSGPNKRKTPLRTRKKQGGTSVRQTERKKRGGGNST